MPTETINRVTMPKKLIIELNSRDIIAIVIQLQSKCYKRIQTELKTVF